MKTNENLLSERPKQLEIMVTSQETENKVGSITKWGKIKTHIKSHETVYITSGAAIIGSIVGRLIVANEKNKEMDNLIVNNEELDAQNFGQGLVRDLVLDCIDELEGELTNLHEKYSWVNSGKGL